MLSRTCAKCTYTRPYTYEPRAEPNGRPWWAWLGSAGSGQAQLVVAYTRASLAILNASRGVGLVRVCVYGPFIVRVWRRHTSSASESKNTTAETDRRTSARRHSRAADDTAAVTDHWNKNLRLIYVCGGPWPPRSVTCSQWPPWGARRGYSGLVPDPAPTPRRMRPRPRPGPDGIAIHPPPSHNPSSRKTNTSFLILIKHHKNTLTKLIGRNLLVGFLWPLEEQCYANKTTTCR